MPTEWESPREAQEYNLSELYAADGRLFREHRGKTMRNQGPGPDTDKFLTRAQIEVLRNDPRTPNEIYFDCGQLLFGNGNLIIVQRVAEAWQARHVQRA